jgi:hypothetical protein
MKNITLCSIFFVTIIATTSMVAQNTEKKASLDKGPISEQFDYTIEKSSKYEEYRVVHTAWLYKLKANVLDSLETFQKQIKTERIQIDSLNSRIETLKKSLETTKNELNKAVVAKNSVPFLGAEMPKGKYASIMWSLVAILAVATGSFLLLFKRSNHITAEMKERYSDLEKEYEEHRKRALEKEKLVARQHLNELNKLRGRD